MKAPRHDKKYTVIKNAVADVCFHTRTCTHTGIRRGSLLLIVVYKTICVVKSHFVLKSISSGFPGGAVVRNPPANAGDTGSCLGPGRSHMPRSN